MSEDTPDYGAGKKPYAVMRSDRQSLPVFCETLDEARELAAQRVAQHGGSVWVFRLEGTAQAVSAWLPGPDSPYLRAPDDKTRRPSLDSWRVHP